MELPLNEDGSFTAPTSGVYSFRIGEEVWESFTWIDGRTIWQKKCTDCECGLLLGPARFCPICNGTGYITSFNPEEYDGEKSATT